MALEFLFATTEETNYTGLEQGDILNKTEELQQVLRQAHSYYADAEDYTHFMVLTQSCDLVRRNGKQPKSRYISLAAIRPLSVLVDRLISKYEFQLGKVDFPFQICNKEHEVFAKQTLEKLLHNTIDGFFFIRKDSHPTINKDLCVFLPLSIAIRNEHYDDCLKSKVAQLDNIFQAKLGWLVGAMYSRVGTPDLEEHVSDPDSYKESFYEEILFKETAWLSSPQLSVLKDAAKKWRKENPGHELDKSAAHSLIGSLPTGHEIIAERIVQLLTSEEFVDDDTETKKRIRNMLANDPSLRKLINAVSR